MLRSVQRKSECTTALIANTLDIATVCRVPDVRNTDSSAVDTVPSPAEHDPTTLTGAPRI
jgi:hypothetical protein